jgi:hypothetical protein
MVVYAKSILAGLLGVLMASGLAFFVLIVFGLLALRGENDAAIGWDPISWLQSSALLWSILLGSFASGFFWQFRRLSRRSASSS